MSGSIAVAPRRVAGSRTNTSVPAGASSSSSATPEPGPAREDDVKLLVAPGAGSELVVLLDHPPARLAEPVGVDAECVDPERDPDRDRVELPRETVELVELGGLERRPAHAATASASRTSRPSREMPSSIASGRS